MHTSRNNSIDSRSQQLLTQLIDCYIRDGQPVGSKKLAEHTGLQLSPASIRSIMADLEAAGYLSSPHTSAGRIPTAQGYRLFVDNLLTFEQRDVDINRITQQLENDSDVISKASTLLSDITKLAGVVTIPMREQLLLKQVEFLPLSDKRVLVILIVNNQEVQNRVITTDREYTRSELEQAGNYITHHFAGKDLLTIRNSLLRRLRYERKDLEQMIKTVLDLAEQTIDDQTKKDYVLAGETHLFENIDVNNLQRLRGLFDAFAQKQDVLHLLERVVGADGIQIFIGEESGHHTFADYSVVAAPYRVNDKVVGVLGVIGPTRMPYKKAISAVDVTAKLLSQYL